jgi:hypothetical protein
MVHLDKEGIKNGNIAGESYGKSVTPFQGVRVIPVWERRDS